MRFLVIVIFISFLNWILKFRVPDSSDETSELHACEQNYQFFNIHLKDISATDKRLKIER